MPSLQAMSAATFEVFAQEANASYAQDHVIAGTWSQEEALSRARAQFDQLLPQGMQTPDHFFYDVLDDAGEPVGHVWFAVVGTGAARAGYVYNIRIHPAQQRKGHGTAALQALERIAADMNLPAIRLNVFGHNPGAEALYRSLGYQVASTSMRKLLATSANPGT